MLSTRVGHPTGSSLVLAPAGARVAPLFCLLLLTAACALASLVFACTTPFAAFAALAAVMLPLSVALPVVMVAWIVNQAIGFGVLGYPLEPNTLLWGLAIGVAALVATGVAAQATRLQPIIGRAATLAAVLIAAYATYEIVLFAFTPLLGDGGAFSPAIVARLGVLNLVWMIGLSTLCETLRALSGQRTRLVSGPLAFHGAPIDLPSNRGDGRKARS
jgi:hypothetical protein